MAPVPKSVRATAWQKITEALLDQDATLNINELYVLSLVEQQAGITIDDIVNLRDGNITRSSISRIVGRLSDDHTGAQGLITKEDGWTSGYPQRRTKAIYMTTKGQQLMNSIYGLMAQ